MTQQGTTFYTAKTHTTGECDVVQSLVDAAHQICPYSEATRGNIDVATTVI